MPLRETSVHFLPDVSLFGWLFVIVMQLSESSMWEDHSVINMDLNGPTEDMCLIPIAGGMILYPRFPLVSLPWSRY